MTRKIIPAEQVSEAYKRLGWVRGVAKEMRCSPRDVLRSLHAAGVPIPPQGRPKVDLERARSMRCSGERVKVIAAHFGVTATYMSKVLRQPQRASRPKIDLPALTDAALAQLFDDVEAEIERRWAEASRRLEVLSGRQVTIDLRSHEGDVRVEQPVARQPHKLEAAGSSPAPATKSQSESNGAEARNVASRPSRGGGTPAIPSDDLSIPDYLRRGHPECPVSERPPARPGAPTLGDASAASPSASPSAIASEAP